MAAALNVLIKIQEVKKVNQRHCAGGLLFPDTPKSTLQLKHSPHLPHSQLDNKRLGPVCCVSTRLSCIRILYSLCSVFHFKFALYTILGSSSFLFDQCSCPTNAKKYTCTLCKKRTGQDCWILSCKAFYYNPKTLWVQALPLASDDITVL